MTRKYLAGATPLDFVLDAQRRLADAGSAYYRSLADFNRSVAEVHYARGTLLDYNGIFLTEGPSPLQAYQDAQRMSQRVRPAHLNYGFTPPVISTQPLMQATLPPIGSTPVIQSLPEVMPATPPGNPPAKPLPEPMLVPPDNVQGSPAPSSEEKRSAALDRPWRTGLFELTSVSAGGMIDFVISANSPPMAKRSRRATWPAGAAAVEMGLDRPARSHVA